MSVHSVSMDHSLPGHLGSIISIRVYNILFLPLSPPCISPSSQTKESRFTDILTPTSDTKSGSTSFYNRWFLFKPTHSSKTKWGICLIFELILVNRFLLTIPDGINDICYHLSQARGIYGINRHRRCLCTYPHLPQHEQFVQFVELPFELSSSP